MPVSPGGPWHFLIVPAGEVGPHRSCDILFAAPHESAPGTSRHARHGRYRITPTLPGRASAKSDPAIQKPTFARTQSATIRVSPITSAVWGTATAPHATFASDVNYLDGVMRERRLLPSAEIFPFEGSNRASALEAVVPGLHLLVVCRGGQLFVQLKEGTEPL